MVRGAASLEQKARRQLQASRIEEHPRPAEVRVRFHWLDGVAGLLIEHVVYVCEHLQRVAAGQPEVLRVVQVQLRVRVGAA